MVWHDRDRPFSVGFGYYGFVRCVLLWNGCKKVDFGFEEVEF
jgi:hypothetical protein